MALARLDRCCRWTVRCCRSIPSAALCGPPGPPSTALQEPIPLPAGRDRSDATEAQSDLEALQASHSRRVRLVVTAAQPLAALVAAGRFSASLAYGLATVTIELPPLATRPEDLPLLAQAFLEDANAKPPSKSAGLPATRSTGWRPTPGRATSTSWPT